jgi:hypothetical protein
MNQLYGYISVIIIFEMTFASIHYRIVWQWLSRERFGLIFDSKLNRPVQVITPQQNTQPP